MMQSDFSQLMYIIDISKIIFYTPNVKINSFFLAMLTKKKIFNEVVVISCTCSLVRQSSMLSVRRSSSCWRAFISTIKSYNVDCVYSTSAELTHRRSTERHLPLGSAQCHLNICHAGKPMRPALTLARPAVTRFVNPGGTKG